MILNLDTLTWRPMRGCDFASEGSIAVHRFPGPIYLVSNAAWVLGSFPVGTVPVECPQFPTMPRVFPARFSWCSDPAREGDAHAHGFHSFMSPDNPGDVGGAFIELHPPATGCTPGCVYTWMDRSPVAAYHRGTGKPLTRRDIGISPEYRLQRGSDSIERLPMFLRGAEPADLQSWEAPDEAHLVRTYMRALGLWRATKSPVARWHILMVAADAMLSYQMAIIPQTSGWVPFSLGQQVRDAIANPHKGGRIVRGIAWVLRVLVAALEVGAPNREEIEITIGAILTYWQAVQLENGALYSASFGYGMDQDAPVYVWGLDPTYNWTTSWQTPFAVRALWETQHQIPRERRRVIGIMAGLKKQWDPEVMRVPGEDGSAPGLPLYLVTGENGVPLPKITWGVGAARGYADADSFSCFSEAGLQ